MANSPSNASPEHGPRRSYAPILDRPTWHDAIRRRRITDLPDALDATVPYDRVSGDRALAIWSDLELIAPGQRVTIADLGCNTGVIGQALACAGHRVVGIDNDIAGAVQDYYPANNGEIARRIAEHHGISSFSFRRQSVEDFVATGETLDVGLLLSVAHQWWAGYAGTTAGKKSLRDIHELAGRLLRRFRLALYLEHPLTMDGMQPGIDASSFLSFPQWFVDAGHARAITPLALSPDAEGNLRMLYRITPQPPSSP